MKGHQFTQERGEEAPQGQEGQERGGPEPCLGDVEPACAWLEGSNGGGCRGTGPGMPAEGVDHLQTRGRGRG